MTESERRSPPDRDGGSDASTPTAGRDVELGVIVAVGAVLAGPSRAAVATRETMRGPGRLVWP
jgi:hypothetical protein